jgi:ATP-dependent exoDNAse (exonuclease V) alpha subunit
MTFDYSNKSGVLYSYAYAIDENNKRVKVDNLELWNKAEQAEKRKDARVGREYIIAIPHELMQKANENRA